MQYVQVEGFTVSGLQIRTTNDDEMEPSKARIGRLWGDYFACCNPDEMSSACYGVYSGYSGDETGQYDVTAGVRGSFPAGESVDVHVPSGTYLRFEKSGVLPDVTVQLWQEVWAFFQQEDAPARCFIADFEEYVDEKTVAIYIGLKENPHEDF